MNNEKKELLKESFFNILIMLYNLGFPLWFGIVIGKTGDLIFLIFAILPGIIKFEYDKG